MQKLEKITGKNGFKKGVERKTIGQKMGYDNCYKCFHYPDN